jgi:hypothetical protein
MLAWKRGARLGVQIAIHKMKISSPSKTWDMSDVGVAENKKRGMKQTFCNFLMNGSGQP